MMTILFIIIIICITNIICESLFSIRVYSTKSSDESSSTTTSTSTRTTTTTTITMIKPRIQSVIYINLDESIDRRKLFETNYEKYPIYHYHDEDEEAQEHNNQSKNYKNNHSISSSRIVPPTRLSAVRGNITNYLNDNHCTMVIKKDYDYYQKRDHSRLGCALSHMEALKLVLQLEEKDQEKQQQQNSIMPSLILSNTTTTTTKTTIMQQQQQQLQDVKIEYQNWYLICEDDAVGNFTALTDLLLYDIYHHYYHFGNHPSQQQQQNQIRTRRRLRSFKNSNNQQRQRQRRINAINLYSPKPHFKPNPSPGFGTRTTAYLVTAEGALWMYNRLVQWNYTTFHNLCFDRNGGGNSNKKQQQQHNNQTTQIIKRRKFFNNEYDFVIKPVDIVYGRSPQGWVHAISYKGGSDDDDDGNDSSSSRKSTGYNNIHPSGSETTIE